MDKSLRAVTCAVLPLAVIGAEKTGRAAPEYDEYRGLGAFAVEDELGDDARGLDAREGMIGSARGSLGFVLVGGVARFVVGRGAIVRWHVSLEVHLPLERLAHGGRPRPFGALYWPAREVSMGLSSSLSSSSSWSSWSSRSSWSPKGRARWKAAVLAPILAFAAPAAAKVVGTKGGGVGGAHPSASASGGTASASFAVAHAVPVAPSAVSATSVSAPIGAPVAAVAPGTSPSTNDSADDAPLGAGTLRALIVAAWSHAGVDHDEVTADLAARARASALVPHLSFRVRRGADIAARVYTYSSSDTRDHTSASDTTLTFFETRLAWNLDRLVFATEEISLERLKLQRAELKQRIAAKVIELALRWQRARRASVDPNLLAVERAEAAVVTLEASLALEAYTGGGSAKLLSP